MTARVLVVDDVELNVKLLEAKLSSEYFQVIPAFNGPTALELADAELPDIILLDINLPDLNGIGLLRHIRKQHPAITVIMLSNQGGVFYRQLCMQLGATHYIDKSTEFQLVPSVIENLCKTL